MSEIICSNCGRQTISSMSLGCNEKDAVQCFVAFEKDKAVKGCGYDTSDSVSKKLADEYMIYANKILNSLNSLTEW